MTNESTSHGGVSQRGTSGSPDRPPVAPEDLNASVEALLISNDRPITAARLAEALGLARDAEEAERVDAARADAEPAAAKPRKARSATPIDRVRAAVAELNADFADSRRSFRIEEVAGGYRLMTLPKFGPLLDAFHGGRERATLSRAALETLAIVAYKQPITRATLESIRGVSCGEILRSLMERRLVTITGRADEIGRPILYGTARQFLEAFGLASLKDLPTAQELRLRNTDEPIPTTAPTTAAASSSPPADGSREQLTPVSSVSRT